MEELPNCINNEDIRKNGNNLIDQIHQYIELARVKGETNVDPFLEDFHRLQAEAAKGKTMTSKDVRSALTMLDGLLAS